MNVKLIIVGLLLFDLCTGADEASAIPPRTINQTTADSDKASTILSSTVFQTIAGPTTVPQTTAPITCPDSFNITNAQSLDCSASNNFNDTCDITCLNGYYNDGDKQAICNDTNTDDDTNSDAITCADSLTITNSQQSTCNLNTFSGECDITCLDGYYNDGDKQATCIDINTDDDTNSDGEWDKGSANCTAIRCPNSLIIPNSQQSTCNSNTFGDECVITCLDGYYNDGTKQATCKDTNTDDDTNSDGEWDKGGANCKAITCPGSLTILNSQTSTCNPNNFADECDITCLDGYYNDGNQQATCIDTNTDDDTNSDGKWDEGTANCKVIDTSSAITCPDSLTIANSQPSTCNLNMFGDECHIKCLDGYYNDGDKQATCIDKNTDDDTNSDGKWNEGSANCKVIDTSSAITCPNSLTIANSQPSTCNLNMFGDECHIKCLDGYYNDGDKQATCIDKNTDNDTNSDSEWDEGSSSCKGESM
ncbi:E-selectin-like [Styela clava]